MRFLFLGTASGMPTGHRRHSCLLVEENGEQVLVDAGEGAAAGLLQAGIEVDAITRVVITHTHADHVTGLPLLLQGMHLAGRTRPLSISVPPGRVQWFRDWLRGMYIFTEKWSFPFEVLQYGDRVHEDDTGGTQGLRVLPFANGHLDKVRDLAAKHDVPAGSYSLHVSGRGGSAVLSSDIAALDDVAAMAAGCDVLVVESTHVSQDAIHALASAHPELRIICTHIPQEMEDALPGLERRSALQSEGRILYANDGMEFILENDTA